MWFIFPQIQGLGNSSLSVHYAISGLEEAKAYLDHSILGLRLIECCRLVTAIEGQPIEKIFGHIDSLKFRSSLTLFSHATAPPRGGIGRRWYYGLPAGWPSLQYRQTHS
jgi:uncharacterized protein (DUF1810 family)